MTTVSRKCLVQRPIVERIQELRAKLVLLEGDRTAYYEKSFFAMQSNKEKIATLRKEVHDLRLVYFERLHKDDAIISQAFQNRPVEKSAFMAKTSEQAIQEIDFRVSSAMKRFNHSKYLTATKELRLQQLRRELADAESDLAFDEAETKMRTPPFQKIRDLENRVDKLELKGNECEFIQKTYDAIFKRLYDEHVRCNRTLDEMEQDIIRCRAENRDLRGTHKEAHTMQDAVQRELRQHEQFQLADRKRRDVEAMRMRRVVEDEKRISTERSEKAKGGSDSGLDVTHTQDSSLEMVSTVVEDKKVPDADLFEDSLQKLQDVTGMSCLKSIISKFESQLIMKDKLVLLINKTEKNIQNLREDCGKKREQLAVVKHGFEMASAEVQQKISGKNAKMNEVTEENHQTTEKYEAFSLFFAETKAGLESLMEKLTLVRLQDKPVVLKPGTPEEYMMELFGFIQKKIAVLIKELKDHDVEDYQRKMATEEDLVLLQKDELEEQMKQKLPIYNDRVSKQSENNSDEELDSGPDDPSFKNRFVMKHDSTQFIEMRMKKRHRKRKHRK